MGSITSIKCVLTQEHLDAICAKYFVPEEVHPQLPSSDATMHERPAGKVGMYTRFFDYANYRIPFSTFFVSVLTHFRIPFTQLSVFGSAKVSHFEILCRVCNIEPDVGLFRYFYTHNYKNGWFGFTKRPNVRACYSKNLDSVKNWNDHFFWVDEFVVPANARFKWFSGSNIVKDRAPAPSEYNVEHVNALIAQASPFLRFPEEFLCWVGISRNYLLNKDSYPRFEYEDGEGGFFFLVVERPRAENEGPIVTVAKNRTVTLLPTSVVRSSGELSTSVEREFGDASVGDGGDQGFDSAVGQAIVEPSVPVTTSAEATVPKPQRSKKKHICSKSALNSQARNLKSLHLKRRLSLSYEILDILGMYYNKQIDYVYLLWEDFMFQVENKDSKKNNDMFYPRFTKVIVDYFMVPLDEIEIDENLRFVEEPIEIVERDVKKLKRRRIPLVKVRWNSRQGAEYTWEHEDQFRMKYPHLFSEPVLSSSAAT
ncbi:hypothetical protein Tco_0563660 [Tanacetum coccineum]